MTIEGDDLDPATLDALNALTPEAEQEQPSKAEAKKEDDPSTETVEAEAKDETEEESPEAETQGDTEEKPDADKSETVGRKPKSGVEKDIQRLLRKGYAERSAREEAERRASDLERELAEIRAAKPAEQQQDTTQPVTQRQDESPQAFEARVQAEAQRRSEAAEFNARCNAVFEKGLATHKDDFKDARDSLVESFGRQMGQRPEFLQAITRIDNGHDVFRYLGKNLEDAERLFRMSPVDLIMEVKDIGSKLKQPKPPSTASKAPPPLTPLSTSRGKPEARLEDEKMPMDQWSKEFLKQMAN